MPKGDRLGALQMREPRHDCGCVRFGLRQKRLHESGQLFVRPVMGIADPQADIDRHLIVATPGMLPDTSDPCHRIAMNFSPQCGRFWRFVVMQD